MLAGRTAGKTALMRERGVGSRESLRQTEEDVLSKEQACVDHLCIQGTEFKRLQNVE